MKEKIIGSTQDFKILCGGKKKQTPLNSKLARVICISCQNMKFRGKKKNDKLWELKY